MNTLLLTPQLDNRSAAGTIRSRIGLGAEATQFSQFDNLYDIVQSTCADEVIHCVLVDEAQFLTRQQVFELTEVVDQLDIPVLTYGLRTDFQGALFEGSMYLLAWSDSLIEIKTICHCGSKATRVLRIDGNGSVIRAGEQIRIGGNDSYLSVCRKHFKEGLTKRQTDELPFTE